MKLLTLLLVGLPVLVSAETKDVLGWGKTKWGMTGQAGSCSEKCESATYLNRPKG